MEKISGILPATARITTVDLKNSGTARSGMPSFGRDVGLSSVTQRRLANRAGDLHKEQMEWRHKSQDPKAEIVQRMADNFFMRKSARQKQEEHVDLGLDQSNDMRIEVPMEDSNTREMNMATANGGSHDEIESWSSAASAVNSDVGVEDEASASTHEVRAGGSDEGEDAPVTGRYLDVRV